MKILVISSMWPDFAGQPGYSGLFVKEQVDALRGAGHTVDVELLRAGRGLVGLVASHIRFVLANRRIRQRAVTGTYDVLHVHSGSAGLACLAARRRVPVVMTHHGEQIFHSRFGSIPFLRWVDTFVASRMDRLVVVSDRLAQIYRRSDPIVIPCGIASEFFSDLPSAEARERLGLRDGMRYVLFPADPARAVKNYARFEATLKRLRAEHSDVTELVLFDPKRPRQDVPILFRAVDALLLTSNSEGSPQVVKEAICAELPVVATDVGDVAQLLDGLEPGGVVELVHDGGPVEEEVVVANLATALVGTLERGGRSNAAAARERYSNVGIVGRLTKVYAQVSGARRASSDRS